MAQLKVAPKARSETDMSEDVVAPLIAKARVAMASYGEEIAAKGQERIDEAVSKRAICTPRLCQQWSRR